MKKVQGFDNKGSPLMLTGASKRRLGVDDILSPRDSSDINTTPPGSLIEKYRIISNSPLTADLMQHDNQIFEQRRERLLNAVNAWYELYFDQVVKCFEFCTDVPKIQIALNQLEVFLGPKVYKKQMHYREMTQICNFAKWKKRAKFELFGHFVKALDKRLIELEKKIEQNNHGWLADLFVSSTPYIIKDSYSRKNFLQKLCKPVFYQWRDELRTEYEQQYIDVLALNLVYMGQKNSEIIELVKYPLSKQFAAFLTEIETDFIRLDCVVKFSNNGDIKEFCNEIAKMKASCEHEIERYDINPKKNKLIEVLTAGINDYKSNAINLINKDKKENNNSPFKDQKAEEIVDKILQTLHMEELEAEDYPIPLAIIKEKKKNSLIELAVKKFGEINRPGLKEKFFEVIELLYEYGAYHKKAFGSEEKDEFTQIKLELAWKFVSLQIASTPAYSEFEAAMKKTLFEYCQDVWRLFGANCWVKLFYDFDGLKRTRSLYDVQRLAYALSESSRSFNDSILSFKLNELERNIRFRTESADLYAELDGGVRKPVVAKFFTFFGDIRVDTDHGISIVPSEGNILCDENMLLWEKNKKLQETLESKMRLIDNLNKKIEAIQNDENESECEVITTSSHYDSIQNSGFTPGRKLTQDSSTDESMPTTAVSSFSSLVSTPSKIIQSSSLRGSAKTSMSSSSPAFSSTWIIDSAQGKISQSQVSNRTSVSSQSRDSEVKFNSPLKSMDEIDKKAVQETFKLLPKKDGVKNGAESDGEILLDVNLEDDVGHTQASILSKSVDVSLLLKSHARKKLPKSQSADLLPTLNK
jgi:hypothetical protein